MDSKKPGRFDGPKQPPGCGGRALCQYVPPEGEGGPKGAKEGYWKTKLPGQKGWNRFDLTGNPITPDQAHPGQGKIDSISEPTALPVAAGASRILPWLGPVAVFVILFTASPDAN